MPSDVMYKDKKWMWDGVDYPSEEKVLEKIKKYQDDGFEVERYTEDGKTYLYTRRVAKVVVVEGQ